MIKQKYTPMFFPMFALQMRSSHYLSYYKIFVLHEIVFKVKNTLDNSVFLESLHNIEYKIKKKIIF